MYQEYLKVGIQAQSSHLEELDAIFSESNSKTPGFSLGVIQNSQFILQRNYGLANLEHNVPITAETVFNIASLSKQFTGAAIALFLLDNKINLEDEVEKYLPDFAFAGKGVKIKHLIYMTSGINDYYYNPRTNGDDWSTLHYFSINDAIAASAVGGFTRIERNLGHGQARQLTIHVGPDAIGHPSS